ncbi:hypothetical protein EDB85DRAFT_1895384 [Lactarius pseudohatsudake]|nr:hypothetical protein EDB85DRAFT_1895384 [Lactarius pseudohatsudake]
MAIIFSPLKQLQAVQVLTFARYQIKAIAINEDTLSDPDLWQPEQLCMSNGHLPWLARLVAEDQHFVKLIRRVHVDEAHFIYTAGLKRYRLPAFQSAWAQIGEFHIKIGNQVPVQALSGTQPPHIKAAIIKNLLFDESQLNHPNIVYATHPIVGNLSDFRNLDFLVPQPYHTGWSLPKTVVFHDSVEQAAEAALYHTQRLPEGLQKRGLVMHYHRGMSKEYLTQVYEDFSDPNGHCRILHATKGALTGLNIPDVEVIVQYGITREVPTALQQGGWGGCRPTGTAIFLLMYKPWVKSIDPATVEVDTASDLDHPNVPKLTVHSTKQARTGIAMIKIIQREQECLHQLFADYLNDTSLDDLHMLILEPLALHFTTGWCCNQHPRSNFQWQHFFKGRLLYQDPESSKLYYGDVGDPDQEEILPPQRKKRKGSMKICAANEHKPLISRLLAWRAGAHSKDPLAPIRPPYFIIDDPEIQLLARLHLSNVVHPEQIVAVFCSTQEWQDEWSHQVFEVIQSYNRKLVDHCKDEVAHHTARQKRVKYEQDQIKFAEASNETAECVRQEVLMQHMRML